MEENRSRLDLSAFSFHNQDGNAFRSYCREELTSLVSVLNGEKFEFSQNQRIILSGHQPLLNHPGVWIKNFLLDRLGRESGAMAVNLEVDSDMAGAMAIPMPTVDGRLKIVREPLGRWTEEHALESLPAPSASEWEDFVSRGRPHLASLPNAKILERMETMARMGLDVIEKEARLSGFFTRLRREFESPAGLRYASLPLSLACGTQSFLHFFLKIASDAKPFAAVYNSALEDYRKRHKLRYKANPFPDLQADGGRWELPFWWIDEKGGRNRVFASAASSRTEKFFLELEGSVKWEVDRSAPDEAVERLLRESIRIRPKALALTLFFRLFFCDLFLHGIGGGKYDEASDFIMQKYFGIVPPHYLAASLTFYPDLGIEGFPQGEEERLQTRLREMKFKPEKFQDAISDESKRREFMEVLNRKKKLLGEGSGENKGKEFFRRIQDLNETLSAFVKPARLETERKLAGLREREDVEEALRFREYPFFLFDPLDLSRIGNRS